jgi:hypothetical protein
LIFFQGCSFDFDESITYETSASTVALEFSCGHHKAQVKEPQRTIVATIGADDTVIPKERRRRSSEARVTKEKMAKVIL